MILDFSQNNIFVVFEITESNNVALRHFSAHAMADEDKNANHCLVSDIHISGGRPDDRFGAKHCGESKRMSLKYQNHNFYENENGNKLEFLLKDDKIEVVVHYQFYKGISAVRAWKTVTNISEDKVGLEYVSSFSYTGITEENLKLLIPHNSWCSEVDWEEFTPEQLGMKKYRDCTTKRIAVSNTGS